ncbi:MAG: DUF5683 domain-containing protein, partial [Ferruginibacter sp.]
MNKSVLFLFILFLFLQPIVFAQNKPSDSIPKKTVAVKYKPGLRNIFNKTDTSKPYSPRIAVLRSAVLPGWGQATNKKYWKIPLVYGALGITAGVF